MGRYPEREEMKPPDRITLDANGKARIRNLSIDPLLTSSH